ncbi:MAG: protease complex subunit PrcB family protein [Flavobacteriaceae bacterium]
MVIAVFLEVKSSGWEVRINSITENENSLVVRTNENQFDSSVITQPFSIVKIHKTEKQIQFNLELMK